LIPWLLTSWPSQIALVVFAVWFLNGLRKAFFKPRLKYVSHARIRGNVLVSVKRQQMFFPWQVVDETWLLRSHREAIREGDGYTVDGYDRASLAYELWGCFEVAELRGLETDEMLKDEAKHAN
jgi:hypothetical protein